MKNGAILTIAVLILVVVSAISGYIMWISFNRAQSVAKQFMNEHEYRYSKLISRSLIYNVIHDVNNFEFESYPPDIKSDFVDYLRKNQFVGYGWVDVAESATNIEATNVSFDGEPWKDWEVLLMRFKVDGNKMMYVAKAEKRNQNFRETFAWAYGESRGRITWNASDIHINAAYSPENVSLGGSITWTNKLNVYGPIITKGRLSIGSQHPYFHDTVIASSMETTEWFGRATFDKDVYVKNLYLNTGAKLNFNSNLYAENIQGNGWNSKINVDENLCASSINLSNSGGLEIGGNLSANSIDIEDTGYIEVDGSMRANDIKLSHIWNGVDVEDDITACSIDVSSGYTSKLQVDSLNASDLYLKNVANFNVDSLNVGDATIVDSNNNININNLEAVSLKFDNNEKLVNDDYMCVNKDLIMTGNTQIDLNRFTVLGNVILDGSRYKVSDESSIVGRYEISGVWNMSVNGETYVGDLTGSQSCWGSNGFKKKVYSPESPSIDPSCLKAGWQRIDRSLLENIKPCQINVPCPVHSCFEEAQDELERLDHLEDPFPDPEEYFSNLSGIVKDASALCSLGSDNPVGIHFSNDIRIEIVGDAMMELHFKPGNIVVKYPVSGNGCPPYNATIYCGSSMRDFKFNGVIFTSGNMTIGKNIDWPPQRTETVYGRLFLIAENNIGIFSPFVYDFLPEKPKEWPDEIEEVYEDWREDGSGETTYIEVLAGKDIDFFWENWWFRGNNRISAEFISLDGRISDISLHLWREKFTLLGGLYARRGVEIDPQNLTLISDKRLTLPEFYTCNGQINDIRYEPFSVTQNGTSSSSGEFDLEVVR